MTPWHMGSLHPVEQALTLALAFGPFLVLAVVVAVRRRSDAGGPVAGPAGVPAAEAAEGDEGAEGVDGAVDPRRAGGADGSDGAGPRRDGSA